MIFYKFYEILSEIIQKEILSSGCLSLPKHPSKYLLGTIKKIFPFFII